MDKWVTRNGMLIAEEDGHNQDELTPPHKKRRLLDNKVEQTSNSIKKTLNLYFRRPSRKKNSIFSSLTNEDCLAYTNMTIDQFSFFFSGSRALLVSTV